MIDWSRIQELRAEMDDAFDEVVSLFLEEADEIMARLKPDGDAPARDAQALAADLHALKGAALNLGLSDFADRCSTGEAAALAGAADRVDLRGLLTCYQASKTELAQGLGQHAA